jgi:hypothetical protein
MSEFIFVTRRDWNGSFIEETIPVRTDLCSGKALSNHAWVDGEGPYTAAVYAFSFV